MKPPCLVEVMFDQQSSGSSMTHFDAFSDVTSSVSPRSEYTTSEYTTQSPATYYPLSYRCENELLSPTAGVDTTSMQHWQMSTGRTNPYGFPQSTSVHQGSEFPDSSRMYGVWDNNAMFETGSHSTYNSTCIEPRNDAIAAGQPQSPSLMYSNNFRVPGNLQPDPHPYVPSYYPSVMVEQPPFNHDAHHSMHMPMHTQITQSGGYLDATMSGSVLQDASRVPLCCGGSCSPPLDEPIKEEPNSSLPLQVRRLRTPRASKLSNLSPQGRLLRTPRVRKLSTPAPPKARALRTPRASKLSKVSSEARLRTPRARKPRKPAVKKSVRKPKEEEGAPSCWVNCHGQETLPTLASGCSESTRLIYDILWTHRQEKGIQMWRLVQRDHEQQTGQNVQRATLQMRYRRARLKWLLWEQLDEQYLRQAYRAQHGNYYSKVLKDFIERGGSRNMALNAGDIKAKCQSKEFDAWRRENGLQVCLVDPDTKGAGKNK